MYSKPLKHTHGLLPGDIIPADRMVLLTRHYTFSLDLNSDNFNSKMSKKFEAWERELCAETYGMLRGNGFSPRGIDGNGEIKWLVAQKDDVQGLVEKYMPDLSENPNKAEIAEMQRQRRAGFADLLKVA